MDDKRSPIKISVTGPSKITTQASGELQPSGSREDFFRDLKKVVKKLPPDHPSRSDSRKR